MNAFRRPSGALKLLSFSWRNKSLTPPMNSSFSNVTLSRATICKYSSSAVEPKPKEDQEPTGGVAASRKSNDSIDPFGIDEVVKVGDKSSVLVQGFYNEGTSPSQNTPPPSSPVDAAPPSPPSSKPEDPEVCSRLSMYEKWLKQRVNIEAAQRSDIGVAESYRAAHFGQVRVDSDNPVYSHGHYDERVVPNETPRNSQRWKAARAKPADVGPITETIEADHSVRIRASDFLKQLRVKEQGDSGEQDAQTEENPETVHPREKVVIERIINPRINPSMDPYDPSNSPSTTEDALAMDSNVIPKPYLFPDYNAITEQDMWNILRKTIVYQNDFLLAINKPSGIPIHSRSRDCRHQIIQFLKKFADLAKVEEVYPLHRLDKETTGILLFAKDKKVASVLKAKFAARDVTKVYLGVTKLCPLHREGCIKIPIGEGKIPGTLKKFRQVLRPDLREYGIKPTTKYCVEAITNYRVIQSIKEASFVEIQPVTGYKHQIRVHFGLGLGCPIIGDHKYSHRDKLAPQRLHPYVLHKIKLKQSKVRELPLHLHCNKISFTLPKEFTESLEPVHIQANIPLFMKYTLKRIGLIR